MADGFKITKTDTKKLRRLARKNPALLSAILREVASQIVGEIKLSMGTSPAGDEYRRGNVVHVASQPGYPPNPDTGTLLGSITFHPVTELSYYVSDGTEYGVFLEIGTERMAARPFMRPVFDRWSRREFKMYLKERFKLT